MAELRLYCERHNDLAAPLGLCCHAAQEYNLARAALGVLFSGEEEE